MEEGVNTIGRKRFGKLQIGIISLTVATAVIHFGLAVPSPWPFNLLFALNSIGYLVLLAGLYLKLPVIGRRPNLFRLLLIAYTLTTIVLFFVMNTTYGIFGLVTKALEALLVVLLFLEKPDRS
jgi:hypothetical protein